MTFSEHDELAIELEAQNTHKLELKLFPATLDLYASSKGTVISTLNGEIRSFQKDKVLETKEVTLMKYMENPEQSSSSSQTRLLLNLMKHFGTM